MRSRKEMDDEIDDSIQNEVTEEVAVVEEKTTDAVSDIPPAPIDFTGKAVATCSQANFSVGCDEGHREV